MAESDQNGSKPEERRDVELRLRVPVTVTWVDDMGESHEEPTFTEVVHGHGCFILLGARPPKDSKVICHNQSTKQARQGRVLGSGKRGAEKRQIVSIELEETGRDFWGEEYRKALGTEEQPAAQQEESEGSEAISAAEGKGEESPSMVRRGLLYALLASVLYYFLGGHSGWEIVLEVDAMIRTVLLPLLFLAGLSLAVYASIKSLRNQ